MREYRDPERKKVHPIFLSPCHPINYFNIPVQKREIFGWAMYDFANSAFATTILAVIFNQYFASVVAGGERGVEFLGFHLHGASFFTFSVSLSMAISAVLAPFLGAVADASASKKHFLIAFCYTAILFTGLLYFVHAGNYWRGAIFFIIANIGFAGGNVYYNAFLPEISTDQNIGRISGLGWALGYIGGGMLLAINLIMLKYPKSLGFPVGYFTVQDCFLSVALWWLIFSLPTFLLLRERSQKALLSSEKGYGYLREGYQTPSAHLSSDQGLQGIDKIFSRLFDLQRRDRDRHRHGFDLWCGCVGNGD